MAASLRHELFYTAQTLKSWVRIPLDAWTFMCIYFVSVMPCVYLKALRRAYPRPRSVNVQKREKSGQRQTIEPLITVMVMQVTIAKNVDFSIGST